MFGGKTKVVSVMFPDPTADEVLAILKAPADHAITIEDAYVVIAGGLSASTANFVNCNLQNAGTSGTATTVISGSAPGTAGLADNVASQMAITDGSGQLTAGQWLHLNYAETGTVAPSTITVVVEYVDGAGSKKAA